MKIPTTGVSDPIALLMPVEFFIRRGEQPDRFPPTQDIYGLRKEISRSRLTQVMLDYLPIDVHCASLLKKGA